MKCFKCEKRTDDYLKDKYICASCREILKVDLVNAVLELDPIYLSESNRNKKGRKHKLSATEENDITWAHKKNEESMGSLAKKYHVSKSTIYNIIHSGKY